MSSPIWFITGASNGMGLLLTLRALKAGHRVIATVRDPQKSASAVQSIQDAGGKVLTLNMEESQQSIFKKVQDAEKIYGHIDYLVNNAAYSLLGPLEHFTEAEIEKQYRANVFGLLFVVQAALPTMRKRRSGLIVNFSSVAGQDTNPGIGAYGSTKAAVEGMSEALSKELAEFGISVLIIEPGAFRTNFLGALQTTADGIPDHYNGTAAEKATNAMKAANGKQPGDPEKAVQKIYDLITGEGETGKLKDKVLRFPIGQDALARIDKKNKKFLEDMAAGKESEDNSSTAF